MKTEQRTNLRWAAEDQCRNMSRAEMTAAIIELLNVVDRYEAALEWYARHDVYNSSGCPIGADNRGDWGERARTALAKEGT